MSDSAPSNRHPAVATEAEVVVVGSLVTMVEEARRGRAAFEALEVQALAALAAVADQQRERLPSRRAVRELPLREIAAEVGAAVRVSDRVMQGMIAEAATAVERFPATVTALAEGRVTRGHVSALLDAGAAIDDEAARATFEKAALEVAERETVGRFRAVVRGMSERINPRSLTERHRLARENRSVSVRDLADGMSQVTAVLPSVQSYGIHDRLTQMAKAVQDHARAQAAAVLSEGGGTGSDGAVASDGVAVASDGGGVREVDERSLGQVRADLFADLLLAGAPALDPTRTTDAPGDLGAVRAIVQITVPVLTAAGVGEEAAVLDGRSPVDGDSARELVGAASGWDRVLTHPVTGAVLAVDRYTPSADLKRLTLATDTRCRAPGCRMPAHRCDLDHNHAAAAGGRTEACNLCHFCRRHHVLKHQPGWGVRQLPGGRIEWTTPTGRVYIDEPPPRAAYLPEPPGRRQVDPREVGAAERGRDHPSRRPPERRRAAPAPVVFVADDGGPPF